MVAIFGRGERRDRRGTSLAGTQLDGVTSAGQNLKSLKNLGARVHSRNLRHQRTCEVVNLHESQRLHVRPVQIDAVVQGRGLESKVVVATKLLDALAKNEEAAAFLQVASKQEAELMLCSVKLQ